MENYLVLNGQKIELTSEQYKEVCNAASPKKNSPFSKREDGIYYCIGDDGAVFAVKDQGRRADARRYKVANYCSSNGLMIKHAWYEELERILWRFSEENGGAGKYFICYDKQNGKWGVVTIPGGMLAFGPTFCSKDAASRAIEEAKTWFFDNALIPEDVFF